jgi:hypothetical protein
LGIRRTFADRLVLHYRPLGVQPAESKVLAIKP